MKILLILIVLLTTITTLPASATSLEALYRCSEDILPRRDELGFGVSIYSEIGSGRTYAFMEELYAAEVQCWPTDPGPNPSPMDCEYEVLSTEIGSFETTSTNSPNEIIFRNTGKMFELKIHKSINNESTGILNWSGFNRKVYCAKIK